MTGVTLPVGEDGDCWVGGEDKWETRGAFYFWRSVETWGRWVEPNCFDARAKGEVECTGKRQDQRIQVISSRY